MGQDHTRGKDSVTMRQARSVRESCLAKSCKASGAGDAMTRLGMHGVDGGGDGPKPPKVVSCCISLSACGRVSRAILLRNYTSASSWRFAFRKSDVPKPSVN